MRRLHMLNRRTVLALGALSLAGCGGSKGGTMKSDDLAVADVALAASDASALGEATASVSAFSADLYGKVAAAQAGNLILSPLSVITALGMTLQGARGETAEQLRTVLHATDDARLAAGLGSLQQALAARNGRRKNDFRKEVDVALAGANSLWGQRGIAWEQPFLTTLARWFGAGMHLVDYREHPEDARGAINDWVSEQTRGRIADLVPAGALDSSSRLTLVNAIWFKAGWQNPFLDQLTRPQPFTRADGSKVEAPFMHGEASSWTEGPGWVATDLPYAGGELAMTVVLPDAGKLAEVERSIDAAWLGRLASGLRPEHVTLALPRWRTRSAVSLADVLGALGMPVAFTGRADLSGMTEQEQLSISQVLHQGWIAVDEKGTEAAAATAVVVRASGAIQGKELIADRPFLYVLRDVPTGAPVFVGRVADPTA